MWLPLRSAMTARKPSVQSLVIAGIWQPMRIHKPRVHGGRRVPAGDFGKHHNAAPQCLRKLLTGQRTTTVCDVKLDFCFYCETLWKVSPLVWLADGLQRWMVQRRCHAAAPAPSACTSARRLHAPRRRFHRENPRQGPARRSAGMSINCTCAACALPGLYWIQHAGSNGRQVSMALPVEHQLEIVPC